MLKNLESIPTISEALGEDWINNRILNKEERSEKHVIFSMFLDESKCRKMEELLSTLKTTLSGAKFLKVVNSLEEKKREKESARAKSDPSLALAFKVEKKLK